MPPLAGLERTEAQVADADTQDANHREAEQAANLTDLPLAAFAHDHAHPSALTRGRLKAHIGGSGLGPVLQNDAPAPGGKLRFIRAAG